MKCYSKQCHDSSSIKILVPLIATAVFLLMMPHRRGWPVALGSIRQPSPSQVGRAALGQEETTRAGNLTCAKLRIRCEACWLQRSKDVSEKPAKLSGGRGKLLLFSAKQLAEVLYNSAAEGCFSPFRGASEVEPSARLLLAS